MSFSSLTSNCCLVVAVVYLDFKLQKLKKLLEEAKSVILRNYHGTSKVRDP